LSQVRRSTPVSWNWRTKEILAKVFHARPGEVEETIKRRMVERKGGGRCSA
jgi:hypothetical protein